MYASLADTPSLAAVETPIKYGSHTSDLKPTLPSSPRTIERRVPASRNDLFLTWSVFGECGAARTQFLVLLREVHAPQQILEARVGAQRIEHRKHLNVKQHRPPVRRRSNGPSYSTRFPAMSAITRVRRFGHTFTPPADPDRYTCPATHATAAHVGISNRIPRA